MKIKTIKSEGLAHNSYILFDQDEAAVIDPRRDCEIYTELAKEECSKIKYILETHRNEDFVIGSLELQKMTSAEIGHSNALPFKYGEHNLADNETLSLGGVKIKTLYTPGHTNESLCYVIYPSQSDESTLVFTGDTLFAGSVGRTDLYGKTSQPTQADKLFSSLHEKLSAYWRPRPCLPCAWRRQRLRSRHKRYGTNHVGLREENQSLPAIE